MTADGGLRDATLCATHVELNDRTGGGVILAHILAHEPALAVIYTLRMFEGDCVGDLSLQVQLPKEDPVETRARMAAALAGHQVTRIICAPQQTSEVLAATTAAELTEAPLVAYIMDDSNLFRDGIPDATMRLLIDRSAVCFAISPMLCDLYQEKFGRPFWLLPPVNSAELFAPPDLAPPTNSEPRGVIIGNVWSPDVVSQLRSTIRKSGLWVDWYGNAGHPFVKVDPEELARDGIAVHGTKPEAELIKALRQCDYAIMPSRSLSGKHPHDFLYRASLPSRLVYLLTTAHLPLVVLGSADTTAAQFVSQFEVGAVSPYEPDEFLGAVHRVTSREERDAIRARAAALSPSFAAEPVAAWIWRSAAAGRAADRRYERLFARFR